MREIQFDGDARVRIDFMPPVEEFGNDDVARLKRHRVGRRANKQARCHNRHSEKQHQNLALPREICDLCPRNQ
jgi:hypothetical protein